MGRETGDWFILRTAGRSTLPLASSLAEDGFEVWTPVRTMRVLTKSMVGNSSALRKSAERRWSSRICWPLSIDAASRLTRTVEASGFSRSRARSKSRIFMLPRTVVTIMCFALKVTDEWAGSRVQVMSLAPGSCMIDSATISTYGCECNYLWCHPT